MKSRTSFFKPAVLRKDATRFAPAWALYSVFLLMFLLLIVSEPRGYHYASTLAGSIRFFMPVVNLGYALLCGQLLFGDLFSSRMCNALHAMPLRRESWFLTHVLSGLCFHFVPNLLFAGINGLLLGEHWVVAGYWLLGVSLQYLCFFGIAVFSALCVGNRFAMALVYGILNFLSLLIRWLVSTLYAPLLYGIEFNAEPFHLFCPVVQMCSSKLIEINLSPESAGNNAIFTVSLQGDWWYLRVCAGIGLALAVLALLLYRRRKLECAGDFMAEPKAAPVFLVLYSLMVATVFYVFGELFSGGGISLLLLAIGVVVGFFTGQMLLKRTIRVFKPKSILGLAALGAALALSLGLTALDPLGVTYWVPEAEDVASVSVSNYLAEVKLESPEDIAAVLEIHQEALDNWQAGLLPGSAPVEDKSPTVSFNLTYTLKSGAVVHRNYDLPIEGQTGQLLRGCFSRPACVLGPEIGDLDGFLRNIQGIYLDGELYGDLLDRTLYRSFVEAILLDCQAGNMAQEWSFHENESVAYRISLYFTNGGENQYRDIRVYDSCENTLAWMEEHRELFEQLEEDD